MLGITLTLCLLQSVLTEKKFAQQLNPVITKVTPWFGGVEGGTQVTISGANLASTSLFTETVVFIGNEKCNVIMHYSGPEKVVCVTPKCYTDTCLSGSIWSGTSKVELSVYVSSVEGIQTTSSVFTYYNYWTPAVFAMDASTWGSATSLVHAKARVSELSDIAVTFGDGYRGYLGTEEELNKDVLNYNTNEHVLYYRPPLDMPGGFYNLTLSVQDDLAAGSTSTGYAKMFVDDHYESHKLSRPYLFQSSLQGTSYSVSVFPTVSSIYPSSGSIGGGTVVRISGSGFSRESHELEVLVGGIPCTVLSSDVNTIRCITSPRFNQTLLRSLTKDDAASLLELHEHSSSFCSYGSPGWWVKTWNHDNNLAGNVGLDEHVDLSFGWRHGAYMSFYESVKTGYDWPNTIGFETRNQIYVKDAGAVFTASFAGLYTFYIASDDQGYLYASSSGVESDEVLIAYNTRHSSSYKYHYDPATQISDPIPLAKGEKIFLRLRHVNTGGYDFSIVSVKISPTYSCEGVLMPDWMPNTNITDDCASEPSETTKESNFPESLIQLNSVPEVQEIHLSFELRREIQMINITGTESGEFLLVVQGRIITSYLSVSSSATEIRDALNTATRSLDSEERETYSFSVWLEQSESSLAIFVQFEVDNTSPLTMLQIYPVSLVGWNPQAVVTRVQEHSPFPADSFNIIFDDEVSGGVGPAVPWDSWTTTVEASIEEYFADNRYNVEVTRSGYSLTGYVWTISFVTPRGDVPEMKVDVSGLSGPNATAYVTTQSNGSTSELWFEPIPSWMTEVPLEWATAGRVHSNVEVYRHTPTGDVIKAVCDSSGDGGPGIMGNLKGNEYDCAYQYSSNFTAVVTGFAIVSYSDDRTVEVGISGHGFSIGGVNNTVIVTIAEYVCNITALTDESITCEVSSVPWGNHGVVVNIEGYGHAISTTDDFLHFDLEIYSFFPVVGSLSGGQRVTIEGRGFRKQTQVVMGSGYCTVESISSSRIVCITPALSVSFPVNSTNGIVCANVTNFHSRCMDELEVAWERNVSIVIDNVTSSEFYKYSVMYSPTVDTISPRQISSALTSVIDIIGNGFTAMTTVSIAAKECVIQQVYPDMISCLLVRSAATDVGLTPVYIDVPGKGYASEASHMGDFPVVEFGFGVNSIYPPTGSVAGGTTLYIDGFGFLDRMPNRHSVTLTDVNYSSSEYDRLVFGLGLSQRLGGTVECTVLEVSFDQIVCSLPSMDAMEERTYRVSVTLNDMTSSCVSNGCLFHQVNGSTPIISSANIFFMDPFSGSMAIDVYGNPQLLQPERVQVSLNNDNCIVVNMFNDSIRVDCPAVTAGYNMLSSFVEGFGYAFVEWQGFIESWLHVTEVVPSLEVGSLGGGTPWQIHGYGFSSECRNNFISIRLSDSSVVVVPFSHIIDCSVTVIQLLTPSVAHLFGGESFVVSTATSLNVTEVMVEYNGLNTSLSAIDFMYSHVHTPIVSASGTRGVAGDNITLLLSMPVVGINSTTTTISINGTTCSVLLYKPISVVSTAFFCQAPPLQGGVLHDVIISVGPFGNALTSTGTVPTFYSEFIVAALASTKLISSVAGGSLIEVTGSGLSAETSVSVCGISCTASHYGYDHFCCFTPSRRTISSVLYFESIGAITDTIENLEGSLFGSTSSRLGYLEDGDYTTYYYHNTVNCYIGIDIPDGHAARPYRLRFYPRLQYAHYIGATVFEGSVDGGDTYIVIDKIESAHEGWNYFEANESTREMWFTKLRFRSSDPLKTSMCLISEIRFLGTYAAQSDSCDIAVSSTPSTSSTVVGTVTYDAATTTPLVKSISPNNGSALGKTTITIQGQNFLSPVNMTSASMNMNMFGMNHSDEVAVHVHLNGMPCEVISALSTEITCITAERDLDHVHHADTSVYVNGIGNAVVDSSAKFLYIDRWSDLTTWRNQEPPVDGDLVWIPEGQVVLLDINTPVLSMLLIEGELYFDTTRDVKLDAEYIYVNGGRLQVGTAAEPYERKAIITLHGDRYTSIEIPHLGSKVLGVAAKGMVHSHGGTGEHVGEHSMGYLEIHGAKRLRTWTKLRETAQAGCNFIITAEEVDFKAGEKIVITGSEIPHDGEFQEEVVTVLSNDDLHTVYFEPPLIFTHRSEVVMIEGREIDLRCEVGLLTRNVVIQGDDKSDSQMFGVHTIGMSGIYRIENAEITKCGQAFNLGRYCTHAHHGGNFEGNYVKANSIHHSFQRAVTTHDTSHWEVRDNVAYDVMGHAYFVEDGNEFYNSISGNLGIRIKTSSALLKSDIKPAVFWTTNPNNFWYDNVGVHSHSFGFWFELPPEPPVGAINNVCSHNEHLGEFINNTFHGNGVLGLRIYPRWTPHEIPCDESSPPAPQYLRDMVSYRNGGNGMFSKNHGDLHHVGHTFVENGGIGISILHYLHVGYTMNPTFLDTYLIGSIDPHFNSDTVMNLAVLAPQDEFFYMKDTTVINYGRGGALSGCNGCLNGENMNQGAKTYRFSGLKFVNTTRRTRWSPHYKQIFWDLDGTLAGYSNSYVLQWYDFNAWSPHCSRLPIEVYGDTMICVNTTVRRVEIDFVEPIELDFTDLSIYGDNRSAELYFLPYDTYGWVAPLVVNHTYSLEWTDSGVSPTKFHLNMGAQAQTYIAEVVATGNNEAIGLNFQPNPYDYIPYSYEVSYNGLWKYSDVNFSVSLSDDMASSSFVNGSLNVILSSNAANESIADPYGVAVEARLCPPVGCPIPPLPSIPSNYTLWSDYTSWPNNVVPSANQDVVIEGDMWIHMDISPPPLKTLIVYGKLTFKSGLDETLKLQVSNLLVYGVVEVAGLHKAPFNGKAEIILAGKKSSSLPVLVGEGKFIGSKVLAVMGDLTMIGKPVIESWVRLGQTAYRSSSTAVLNVKSTSWSIGDEVVFAPTAYFVEDGGLWSDSVEAVEIRTVTDISKVENMTQISFDKPLEHTHMCQLLEGHNFCGAVGILSHNLKIRSLDSDIVSDTTNYGFGGHIVAVDLIEELYSAERFFSGALHLEGVELKNLGKVNSDHYAVSFDYSGEHAYNLVANCSFVGGYNFAVKAAATAGLVIRSNVAVGNWGGGIYVESTCSNFTIINNLVVGVHQLPSVLLSSFPWVRPVAGFTVESIDGVVRDNIVAGSYDQGFAIATKFFIRSDSSLCTVTRGLAYDYNPDDMITRGRFFNNEAVGCRGGFSVMNVGAFESAPSDCAVVNGMKAWRNAHTGIMAIAAESSIVVADVVLAENHIGIVVDYFKLSTNAFSGIVMSTIIGSLHPDGAYNLNDTNWDRKCQVFSENDPFGLSTECKSSIGQFYQRVGILVSQFTNRGKTCGVEGRWDQCQPPTTPDRLCSMPFESRYGLPVGIQYTEMHIHDTVFSGFQSNNMTDTARESAAIAINPTQVDQQPSIIVSGLTWRGTTEGRMDRSARFGFKSTGRGCDSRTCMGLDMALIHDIDGSGGSYGAAGQIVFGNPGYSAPYPLCTSASELGISLTFCPSISNGSSTTAFRQYGATWRDHQMFRIGPMQVTREFATPLENRTFASYGPTDHMCPKRFYFSRFPLFLAAGVKHRIVSTGTVPSTWFLRWDSPYETDSTVVEFFIHGSNSVRVFISSNPTGPYTEITRFTDRYPTLADPAGSSARDPQRRTLTVTLRGGKKRFYKFVVVPVVAINMKLEMDFDTFNTDNFIANMAMLLKIPISRIKVAEVRRGSVIIDWIIDPVESGNSLLNTTVGNSTTPSNATLGNVTESTNSTEVEINVELELAQQVQEMQEIVSNFTAVVFSGELAEVLDVPIDTLTLIEPTIPESTTEDFEDDDGGHNTTETNTTESEVTSPAKQGNVMFLVSKPPTSYPTGQPSNMPTGEPTTVPSGEPSSQPSCIPSGQPSSWPTVTPSSAPTTIPSGEPSSVPSGEPSGFPTCMPSGEPSTSPSSQPSGQPTSVPTSSAPTTIPSGEPSSVPSGEPSGFPTCVPSGEPSTSPSSQPSGQPTSVPTSSAPTTIPSGEPSSVPSGEPSGFPTCMPSGEPSTSPSSQPSGQPTSVPTSSAPTTIPSGEPSSVPSGEPSGFPTCVPSGEPSTSPSSQPSGQPTSVPTSSAPTTIPSGEPSSVPSGEPSGFPTCMPSGEPSTSPSSQPSGQPTSVPTSSAPTTIPSGEPSSVPSSEPSIVPSTSPSAEPSALPSTLPSSSPSGAPSGEPSSLPSGSPSCIPSSLPSYVPTSSPSSEPSCIPSSYPSGAPSSSPSGAPSGEPSSLPSGSPSRIPSSLPSYVPTSSPSSEPSCIPSSYPSGVPSSSPSGAPSGEPSSLPSGSPSRIPSSLPSYVPTSSPSSEPSCIPSSYPSGVPSSSPSGAPSGEPSSSPSGSPSRIPSSLPSYVPTSSPSSEPSCIPSSYPSGAPSSSPSGAPSGEPSSLPSGSPSRIPSSLPSYIPTSSPSSEPSCIPSSYPSGVPSSSPSGAPSGEPSSLPSGSPSRIPSSLPSYVPTSSPSSEPSCIPSSYPSGVPSSSPSGAPSGEPSSLPSGSPSRIPSSLPSYVPTSSPSSEPSCIPSSYPSGAPSSSPSGAPSGEPSSLPSGSPSRIPSSLPSYVPTSSPSSEPSCVPSSYPSGAPSSSPSGAPSGEPSSLPSGVPSFLPTTLPSFVPSSGPTFVPSISPTGLPSGLPVSVPTCVPTLEPTTALQTELTISASSSLSGINASGFDADYIDAFKEGLVESSNHTLAKKNINITGVTNEVGLLSGRKLSASSVLVHFKIKFIIEKLGVQRSDAFDTVYTKIKYSIESPKMMTTMNNFVAASKGDSAVILSVESFEAFMDDSQIVSIVSASPSSQPTSEPNDNTGSVLAGWMLSTMILGGSVVVLVLIAGCYSLRIAASKYVESKTHSKKFVDLSELQDKPKPSNRATGKLSRIAVFQEEKEWNVELDKPIQSGPVEIITPNDPPVSYSSSPTPDNAIYQADIVEPMINPRASVKPIKIASGQTSYNIRDGSVSRLDCGEIADSKHDPSGEVGASTETDSVKPVSRVAPFKRMASLDLEGGSRVPLPSQPTNANSLPSSDVSREEQQTKAATDLNDMLWLHQQVQEISRLKSSKRNDTYVIEDL